MYKKNHFVLKQTGSWELIKKAINVLNQVTETNLLVTDFLSVNEIQILKGSCLFWKASGGLLSEAVRVTHPWGQSSAPWGGGETLCDGVAGHHRTQTTVVVWLSSFQAVKDKKKDENIIRWLWRNNSSTQVGGKVY